MPTPEFDVGKVLKEAEAIFSQTKRDLIHYPTEFTVGVAQSFLVLVQNEKEYLLKGLAEGSENDIDELEELEAKFSFDYAHLDTAIGSAVIDLRGKDIDKINTILFSYLGNRNPSNEQNLLQTIHELNQAFIEAGGEPRSAYEDFFKDDVEAA